MPVLSVFDGNFMIHRSFSNAGKHRNVEFIDKNTLSGTLSSICSLAIAQHATHVLVCFDGPQSFRKDIFKGYKANRAKGDATILLDAKGNQIETEWTVGKLVQPMKEILGMAGLTFAHKKKYEADDLMGSAADCAAEQGFACIINTRDKDLAVKVNDKKRISLYWPIEKRRMREKDILEHFGVKPRQIRDFLCLLGDGVDNIPGIPNWGPVKAAKYLERFGSIKRGLEDEEGYSILEPHRRIIKMGKRLTTLRCDQHFNMEDCVVQPFDAELGDFVWKIPDSLKALGDTRKAATIKGLFGRR